MGLVAQERGSSGSTIGWELVEVAAECASRAVAGWRRVVWHLCRLQVRRRRFAQLGRFLNLCRQ